MAKGLDKIEDVAMLIAILGLIGLLLYFGVTFGKEISDFFKSLQHLFDSGTEGGGGSSASGETNAARKIADLIENAPNWSPPGWTGSAAIDAGADIGQDTNTWIDKNIIQPFKDWADGVLLGDPGEPPPPETAEERHQEARDWNAAADANPELQTMTDNFEAGWNSFTKNDAPQMETDPGALLQNWGVF